MTKTFLLLGIFFFTLFAAQAQKEGQPLADSLELVLARTTISETERVDVLTKLAYEYRNLLPRKAIDYGEQAEQLAKKVHYEKKLGEIYLYQAYAYGFFNDIIKSYELSLLAVKYNADYQMTDVLPISKMVATQFNPNSTNETTKNSLYKILPEVNNIKSKVWYIRTIGGFGNAFYGLDSVKQDSLVHLAIKESQENNQKFLEMHNLARLSDSYFLKKNYDTSLYLNQVVSAYLNSIGERRINTENYYGIAEIYLIKSKANPKNLDSAQVYADLSLHMAMGIEYQTKILDCYNLQFLINKERGDSKKAVSYLEKFVALNDSVYGKNARSKIEGIAIKQRDEIADAQLKIKDAEVAKQKLIRNLSFIGVVLILVIAFVIYRNLKKQRALNKQLEDTQQQLIASERMAAFGSVATRMAHEIQNPLNFVTNFSELSKELIDELVESKTDEEKNEAVTQLKENLEKINHHGKRASAIVHELQERNRQGTAHEFFEDKNEEVKKPVS